MIEQKIIKIDGDYQYEVDNKVEKLNTEGWKIIQISACISNGYHYCWCLCERQTPNENNL